MKEYLLYQDEKGIRITSKRFYTPEKRYKLKRIDDVQLDRVPPGKMPGIVLYTTGFAAILVGSLDLLAIVDVSLWSSQFALDFNLILIILGVIAFLIAIFRMVWVRDTYVVRVKTKDGKIKPLVYTNRRYAARLAASLKRAYFRCKGKASPAAEFSI